MKILARTEAKGEPAASPSIWLKSSCVCDMTKRKSLLSSCLVMFRFRLWFKMRFIAMSMVSWSGILVKRLVTS